MNQETIKAVAQFMGRTSLQASEIEAYQKCMRALQEAYDLACPEAEDISRAQESPYDE